APPITHAELYIFTRVFARFPALHSFPTRRSSDLPPLRKHALCESRVVMAHERLIQGVLGIARLDQDLAREIRASGSSRDLLQLRSEEHTSELQSRGHLVCRLLLEKKKSQ